MPSMYNNAQADQDYFNRIDEIMSTREEEDIIEAVIDNYYHAVNRGYTAFVEDIMNYMMYNHMNKEDLARMFAGFHMKFKDEAGFHMKYKDEV